MASGNTISGTVDVARYIQSGLSNLWYQELCADFEIIVGDKTFRCHKVVLAAVSDYFQAMFTSGMKETVQNQCVLNDIQPEVFESTLELIYDESGKKSASPLPEGHRGDTRISASSRDVADEVSERHLHKLFQNKP